MPAPGFKAKLAPSAAPHEFAAPSQYTRLVRSLFGVHGAFVAAAAAAQLLLIVFLPRAYAVVPAAAVLLGYAVSAVSHVRAGPSAPGPYGAGVVRGRASAQLPAADGALGPAAAARGLVVFVLGIQWNHPLGALSPGGREMGRRFGAMHEELLRRRAELGVLGGSEWTGAGATGGTSMAFVYYFRDVASIHAFAHEALHRGAWDWFKARALPHVGIFHETYEVPAGAYETIYENCTPVGLGRASVRCEGEGEGEGVDGGRRWVNTLVSADTPALRTHLARLGREPRKSKE